MVCRNQNSKKYLRDACFVKGFGIEQADMSTIRNSIVTIYDVKTNLLTLLKQLDIDVSEANIMDQTTVLLDEKNIELLLLKSTLSSINDSRRFF